MAERALIGALIAALITALARRTGSLDESGQSGALICATLTCMGGWAWGITLLGYFVAASAVSRLGEARKAELTAAAVPQVQARTFLQVMANGGLYSLLALRAESSATGTIGIAAMGALAAASSDTWATEIGTLYGGRAYSILTLRPVGTGMSGGVTGVGFAAGAVGAGVVVVLAAMTNGVPVVSGTALAVAGGGMAGCVADSLLGATVQARRWCDHCREWTERRVHPCSYRTVHVAGFRWMSNSVVNAIATVVGAGAAVVIARVLR